MGLDVRILFDRGESGWPILLGRVRFRLHGWNLDDHYYPRGAVLAILRSSVDRDRCLLPGRGPSGWCLRLVPIRGQFFGWLHGRNLDVEYRRVAVLGTATLLVGFDVRRVLDLGESGWKGRLALVRGWFHGWLRGWALQDDDLVGAIVRTKTGK